jgi:S1-C subfamily serine protease
LRASRGQASCRGDTRLTSRAGSPAGLRANDVITAVDGRSVGTPAELTGAPGDPNSARDVALTVVRDRKELTLKAKLEGSIAPVRTHVCGRA